MKADWKRKRLGDVCEISSVLVDPRNSKFSQLPHVGGANIEPATGALIDVKTAEEEGLKSGKFAFDERMVLYSKIRPYLMKVARPGFVGLCSADIYPLAPNDDGLDRNYLYYLLLTDRFTQFAIAGSARAGMPKVNREHLFTFEFSLPPLPEQHRIVRILDEAFAAIATAKANAERNLQNARAVFESYRNAAFCRSGGLWAMKPLGDIAEFRNGLNFNQSSKGQAVRIVGVSDFKDNSIVPLTQLASVTIDGVLDKADAIRRDDILTVRSNGSKDLVGRCMLVPELAEAISYSGFIIRIRFAPAVLNPRFLLHFMKSETTRERLTRDGGGANISNINQQKLSALPIPVPSMQTQKELADRLDKLVVETQRHVMLQQRKLAALDELKKSLLHQAFSGRL